MSSRRCKCWDCVGSRDRRQEVLHGGITEEELPRGPRKKKNTKKWCKGKVGIQHIWEVGLPYNWSVTIRAEVCTVCGKHGRFFYPGW